MSQEKLTIALAGNPNCGKTTIFNALTGANQHVGNYSGVTVEKRGGSYKYNDREIEVIDLPGTYSLNYHSPEERVAQEELLSGKVDLLVAIVDSGALSRSLVFVAQLMQLHLPMVLCLNMWDEAEKAGLQLKLDDMQKLLGMPIVTTVGSHSKGIDKLKEAIVSKPEVPTSHLRLGEHTTNAINAIKAKFPESLNLYPDWVATKLLTNDAKYTEEVNMLTGGADIIATAKAERNHIESDTKMDIQQYITEQYYGFADGLLKEVTITKERANAREMSDKIDKWLAHPVLGLVFFFVIIWLLFQLTFTIGQFPMDWIEAGFEKLSDLVSGALESTPMLQSLIVDGIIGGVGGVLVFLPNILILFLGLSFLEDTGYMARTAFLLDKLMHALGLHGRSFIPLITGFGCSVPGIMATRTIAGEKERLTTMFIVPFMSCGARVPIWLLLVPIFFPEKWQGTAMMGIYFVGVVIGLFVAFLLRKTVFKGQEDPFVMELPPYRLPTIRAILMHMWERSVLYLKKAGTIILALSIVLWALAYFPQLDEKSEETYTAEAVEQIKAEDGGAELIAAYEAYMKENPDAEFEDDSEFDQKVAELAEAAGLDPEDEDEAVAAKIEEISKKLEADEPELFAASEKYNTAKDYATKVQFYLDDKQLENSLMGTIGKGLGVIFKPLGFDWKISTAVIASLAAKEVFVSQMGIVYSLGGDVDAEADDDEGAASLRDHLRDQYSTLQGICLIIFMLLTSPCIASLAVAKRESNSWKFALAQFFGMFAIAWILAAIIFAVGSLFA